MSTPDRLSADDAIRRVAAHGLPTVTAPPLTVASLDEVLQLADARRCLPQLYSSVREQLLRDTTPSWVELVRERTIAASQTTLAAHAAAMHVVGRLSAVGVEVVVLKGCATAHLDWERPTDRFSSDVDLMIPGDCLETVVATFESLDHVTPRGRRWSARYGHARTLKGYNGVDLDVHVRIAPGYVGLSIPPDELRVDTVPLSIGGVPMRALDGPNRLIHAAVHSRSVHVGLHSKRDVPQLVLVSMVDWEEAIRRAERWRIGHFFALGVLEAWRSFEIPEHPLTEWAEQYEPASQRERLAARVASDRLRGNVIAAPLALPLREWPGYIGPLLFPSRAYVVEHNKDWRARLRISVSEFRNR